MDRSPQGRDIEEVDGNPGDIIARGEKIFELGQQMYDSADTLETIKNGAVGGDSQQGKAIDALKETIGDSYKTLRESADLYQPVGPIIRAYGESLEGVQPKINNSVEACETKWATYESLPGDAEGSTTPEAGGGVLGIGGHDADSPEAKQEASENAAKKAAYDDWRESALVFDSGYDTWEEAFETAESGVSDELSGSIKDSTWDNWSSFVSVVTTILTWAALIIGVVAIFVTGLGLLAALLAVAAFAMTALKYHNGDATLSELIWAGVGIIPIGKLSNLTKLARLPKLARGPAGLSNAFSRTWKALDKGPVHTLLTKAQGPAIRITTKAERLEAVLGPTLKNTKTANLKQLMGNGTFSNVSVLQSSLKQFRFTTAMEFGGVRLGKILGHYGTLSTAVSNSGGDRELPGLPNWLTSPL